MGLLNVARENRPLVVFGGLHVGEGLDLGMRSLEREDTVLWWY